MEVKIEKSWKERLADEFEKPYFKELVQFVKEEYKNKVVYPKPASIFRAFDLCPFDRVKVVILGQDPYHGPKQANGLCFAVNKGIALPPSLVNIYKELGSDVGKKTAKARSARSAGSGQAGDLERWARQGVLLLNATLTVEAGKAGSHQRKGWEEFTDAVIKKLSEEREGLVFILWGNYAKQKGASVDFLKHEIITSAHPSPLSAHNGFFGSRPFSRANEYLEAQGKGLIEW
ncbi:MAG: uracil-DNA glycosylase [bacterium]|nr:uracil-DNA glycosylase [bacterium]